MRFFYNYYYYFFIILHGGLFSFFISNTHINKTADLGIYSGVIFGHVTDIFGHVTVIFDHETDRQTLILQACQCSVGFSIFLKKSFQCFL